MFSRVRQIFSPRVPELAPREAYRLWAENYPPYAHNLLMEVEERAVRDVLPPVRAKRVLDLACGTGRYADLLHERGAHVTAFDFSYEMLTRSKPKYARALADMCALPLCTDSIDVIVCGLAVGHLEDLEPALREMERVLAPQGTLIYSDFHAATRSWQRTFSAGQQTYAVKHVARTAQEHRAALARAGFLVETLSEVQITHDLARVDARAEHFRARWGDTPVALVVRAEKTCAPGSFISES
jgi:malonyl-CoA O-methyltransferase